MPSSYGFLSTYPPTQCGLATFTSSLMGGLAAAHPGSRVGVVRVVDAPVTAAAPEVVGFLHTGTPDGPRQAAEVLNGFDVAIVQHDYGIFGGADGDEVLGVLDRLRVPLISVLHMVPAHPTPHQREILQRVAEASGAVVAMGAAARDRLTLAYDIDPMRIVVIPHGAPRRGMRGPETRSPRRPMILTWGLLGPGKGIEWAIDGLRQLRRVDPLPEYVVAGQTHPRLHREQGEAYRLHLRARARARGVSSLVRFEGGYLDPVSLTRFVRRSDVIVLPYDSRELVTSGVLVEAIAAGRPVVATAFPHAIEMLASGAGILVPQYDGEAIGTALHKVLTDPAHAKAMAAEAARLAPPLLWPAVAGQYRELAADLLANRTPVPH